MKIIAGIIGGIIVAVLATVLLTLARSSNPESAGAAGAGIFFFVWALSIAAAVFAPSAGKAWRRLLLSSSLLSFLLPLSAVIFTGAQVAGQIEKGGEYAGAAAAGAAIGGTIVSGAMGFVGFFLGVVFLIVGLLVGRDKQVVYVQVPQPAER